MISREESVSARRSLPCMDEMCITVLPVLQDGVASYVRIIIAPLVSMIAPVSFTDSVTRIPSV